MKFEQSAKDENRTSDSLVTTQRHLHCATADNFYPKSNCKNSHLHDEKSMHRNKDRGCQLFEEWIRSLFQSCNKSWVQDFNIKKKFAAVVKIYMAMVQHTSVPVLIAMERSIYHVQVCWRHFIIRWLWGMLLTKIFLGIVLASMMTFPHKYSVKIRCMFLLLHLIYFYCISSGNV